MADNSTRVDIARYRSKDGTKVTLVIQTQDLSPLEDKVLYQALLDYVYMIQDAHVSDSGMH